MANVDLPDEIDLAARSGAEGVGLLRTEFLVTGRTDAADGGRAGRLLPPGGQAPSRAARSSIRTYDLGGDKFPGGLRRAAARTIRSSAGARSASASTTRRSSGPQLRALLRAAAAGNLRMMLPLVTRVDEVRARPGDARGGGGGPGASRGAGRGELSRSA